MSTITKEQAKDLRNAFDCWQQDYDPVEDKEQHDMFGMGMVAMDALLASLEAEPVAIVEPSDYVTAAQLVGEEPRSKAVRPLFEGALSIGQKLYAAPRLDNAFCPKCGGTGLADSGGTHPWGEPIYIECDCRSLPPATVSLTEVQRAMLRDMDVEISAELEEEEEIYRDGIRKCIAALRYHHKRAETCSNGYTGSTLEDDTLKSINFLKSTNTAPAMVSVPDEATPENIEILASTFAPRGVTYQWDRDECNAAADSWNACRAAMLQGADGNSPVIPDGWKLVPVELTGAMTNAMTDAILDDLHNVDVWRSVLAAAPQQEA